MTHLKVFFLKLCSAEDGLLHYALAAAIMIHMMKIKIGTKTLNREMTVQAKEPPLYCLAVSMSP